MLFEWDPKKAKLNLKNHDLDFSEASEVFDDELGITIYDPEHSESEDRFITIGHTSTNRLIMVSHADREDRIRIISAREPTRREREHYEKEIKRRKK